MTALGVLDQAVGLAAGAVIAGLELGAGVDVVLEHGQLGAQRFVVADRDDRVQLVVVGLAQLVGGALDQALKPFGLGGAGVGVDAVSGMRPVAGHRSLRRAVVGAGEVAQGLRWRGHRQRLQRVLAVALALAALERAV